MKKGTKLGLWIAGIALAGVGGYLIYKRLKKPIQSNTTSEISPSVAPSTAPNVAPSTAPRPVSVSQAGGNSIYTNGLLVPTFDSPDVFSTATDTFGLSGKYVGWKVGVATNGIGTPFYKFMRDKKYGYIRQSDATLR
jgi:hypothetical protein